MSQAHLFYIFFLTGILMGILFDIFRILRKSFKTSDFMTIFQDCLFWLLAGGLLFYTVFKFNNGEIRSYVLLGISLGILGYLWLFSKIFIKVNVKIILFLKKIVYSILKVIFYPVHFLWKKVRKNIIKPISFIIINIRKMLCFSAFIRPKRREKWKIFQKRSKKIAP